MPRDKKAKPTERTQGPTLEQLGRVECADLYKNECIESIVAAARWLSKCEPKELEGDDATGWWLLLFIGKRIPFDTRTRLISQFRRTLSILRIGSSATYTATVLARTLARAELLTDVDRTLDAFTAAIESSRFYSELSALSTEQIPTDITWLLQAIYELNGLMRHSTAEVVKRVVSLSDLSNVRAISMLWPIINIVADPIRAAHLSDNLLANRRELISQDSLTRSLDWEVSYLLLATTELGMVSEADAIAEYLIGRQRDSQWDADSDENVESTSLVGLALASYWKHRFANQKLLSTNLPTVAEELLALRLWQKTLAAESIEDLWRALGRSSPPGAKGKLLEQFIAKYATAEQTLTVKSLNLRTESEEIDAVIEHTGTKSFFKAGLMLVECKFTKKKTSAAQIRDFVGKMRNRKRSLYNLGLVVSMAGFTRDAEIEIQRFNLKYDDSILVSLTGHEIQDAIKGGQSLSDLLEEKIGAVS